MRKAKTQAKVDRTAALDLGAMQREFQSAIKSDKSARKKLENAQQAADSTSAALIVAKEQLISASRTVVMGGK